MRKLSSLWSSILMACGTATAPILIPVPAFATPPTQVVEFQHKPDNSVALPDPVETKPRYRYAVMDLSCSVPAGCTGELGIRPWYFLQLTTGIGYNGLAPGVVGSVVLDPIPYAVGITISMDAGHYWYGSVPGISNSPSVAYSFIDPMLGISFGNYRAWRFYIRGGLSYLDVSTSNFNAVINNNDKTLMIGDPKAQGWVCPSAKIGFSLYF